MKKVLASAILAAALLSGCDNGQLVALPPPGTNPVAVITGGNQSYDPLATATFDGSSSYAAAPKIIVNWAWAVTQRPSGSASQPVTGTAPSNVTFFVDLAGNYTLELTVTDSTGLTGSTQYTFNCVPSQGLHLELTWVNQYTHADMDLHLINITSTPAAGVIFDDTGCVSPNSTMSFTSGCDCGYWSCAKGSDGVDFPQPEVLDWDVPNVLGDNPTLDIDNINISVPENINIITPAVGNYEVKVHYYGGEGIPVDATVNVFISGTLAWTGTQHFDSINQLWDAGTVTVVASGVNFTAKTLSPTSSTNLTVCQTPASTPCSGG